MQMFCYMRLHPALLTNHPYNHSWNCIQKLFPFYHRAVEHAHIPWMHGPAQKPQVLSIASFVGSFLFLPSVDGASSACKSSSAANNIKGKITKETKEPFASRIVKVCKGYTVASADTRCASAYWNSHPYSTQVGNIHKFRHGWDQVLGQSLGKQRGKGAKVH